MVIENLINLTKENGNLENGGKGIPTFDMLFFAIIFLLI